MGCALCVAPAILAAASWGQIGAALRPVRPTTHWVLLSSGVSCGFMSVRWLEFHTMNAKLKATSQKLLRVPLDLASFACAGQCFLILWQIGGEWPTAQPSPTMRVTVLTGLLDV